MPSIYDWSRTASENADADTAINFAEHMDPGILNDSNRAVMARISELIGDISPSRTSTGAANTYAITLASSPDSLTDGLTASFIAHQDNNGSSTLAVNSFGAIPLRSISGSALRQKEILTGQSVTASYKLATNEWIIRNGAPQLYSLYQTLMSGSALGFNVGDVKLSASSSPASGFVRLRETVQNLVKADYPDLNAWASGQSYPWGSTSTTFGIPPAGGYFLRFGASNTSVDPDGSRIAGSTQTDQNKAHTHTGSTSTVDDHTHVVAVTGANATGGGGGAPTDYPGNVGLQRDSGPAGAHSHTFTTDSSGGTEARPKSVTFYADMLAVPALVAASLIGVTGYAYKWSTQTSAADPGSGFIGVNNSDISLASEMYISETDSLGGAMAATITDWASAVSSVKGVIRIQKVSSPGVWASYRVSGARVDSGTYNRLTLTPITINGSFTASDNVSVLFFPIGDTGSAGPNTGYAFTWDTDTTDADPGSGKIRVNNAAPASATYIYVSKTSSSGANIGTRIGEWGASTNTVKGAIRLFNVSSAGNEVNYSISGACVDASTYWKVPVISGVLTGSLSAGNSIAATIERVGNQGSAGSGTGTVTSVGLAMPARFTVSGSPVTETGTLTVTENNATANTVLAGPSTGSPAAPALRALVNNDLPASGIAAGSYDVLTVNDRGVATSGSNTNVASNGTYASATVAVNSGRITSVAAGTLPTRQTFTASGTWTRPSGCRAIRITAVGSGGGSGGVALAGSATSAASGGGGSGSVGQAWLDVTGIASAAVTIPEGGSGTAAGVAGGTPTGGTSFGSYLTAPAGAGGAAAMAVASTVGLSSAGGAGGGAATAGSGALLLSGATGEAGQSAIRAAATTLIGGCGGSTPYGGGGADKANTAGAGNPGTGYGSGAGGALSKVSSVAVSGGAGAKGIVIVEEFY